MAVLLLATILLATAAHAQDASLRYATFADLATAQSFNAGAWAGVQCDPQPQCDPTRGTKYVYPMVGLADGTKVAIVLHSGDVFVGEHICNGLRTKCFDLTAGQIAALSTRSQMGTQLPDILQVALVNSRLQAGELTAINNYANAHASFKTKWNALISTAIDLQNTGAGGVWDVMNELQSATVLSAARIAAITALNPAATIVPP